MRTLLVNAYGRVIASNTPEAIVGSLVPQEHVPTDQAPVGTSWTRCAGLPWSLVRG